MIRQVVYNCTPEAQEWNPMMHRVWYWWADKFPEVDLLIIHGG